MNDGPKVFTSCLSTILAWVSLQGISTFLACVASLVAILAGFPVFVDRWRHKLPEWITRHFPVRPVAQ